MKVKISEIVDVFEMMDQDSEYYLDKKTGEIEWINDVTMTSEEEEEITDRLDEHGCFRLPTSYELEEYRTMEEFIGGMPQSVRGRMYAAIQGRGAYRRFKDMVREMGIEQIWYDYRADAFKQRAIEWCEDNGIEYEE